MSRHATSTGTRRPRRTRRARRSASPARRHARLARLLDRDVLLLRRRSACSISRSVAKVPGSRKLIVTLCGATWRATPARNAVSPARAPEERSRPAERHLHRARRDVDDAAELLRLHRVDHLLDQLDRDDHVADHAVDHLLPVELAEIAERRAGIVVHQDVRLRAWRRTARPDPPPSRRRRPPGSPSRRSPWRSRRGAFGPSPCRAR